MIPPAAARLGYDARDLERVERLAGGPLKEPREVRKVLDALSYLDDWRSDYRIRSVRASLHSDRITCIDGAILSYGLLEMLFGDTKRRLLAIHRRDPKKDEECGHCVSLWWDGASSASKIGSFSKSSFKGLGHRDATHHDEASIATSYAEAYVDMEFVPLYFGVTTLEEAAAGLDWRFDDGPLNEISGRLQAAYEYGFSVE